MATAENVSVSIRVRPLNARENGVEQAWRVNQAAGSLTQANLPAKMTPATYTFDHVFDQSATSAQVYNEVAKNVVISAMGGINGTVFCYGQTGSGKTHTMHGNAESPGIVPAAIQDIFSFIQKNPERAFMLRCSYWEIYNEAIKDLLQPSNEDLQIREAVGRGIFVADCKEEIVVSAKTMLNLVALGNSHRHTSETRMNEASSRSHSIFRITIESHLREKSGETTDGAIRVASLNLVDLAGSERQSSTGAEGAKLKEGSQINKSLLILGNVISKLSEGKAGQHIPYRDSKLTRILEPALGGNSRTAILCTVTTAGLYGEETHSTLKFASKAKKIQNCTQVNEVLDDAALMRRYKKEISELRTQIASTGLGANLDKIRELEEEKSKLSSEGEQMAATVSQLERRLKNLESFMINASAAAPAAEKRTSVSRHSWAPGKGSRYDANAAPICLLPQELQDTAGAVKTAWSDVSSAEEVQALREMADLLRQENEALRASGASAVDPSTTSILEAQTSQIAALTKELRDHTAKCSSLERALYIARAEISTLQLKNSSETDDIQAVNTQFTDKIAALAAELEQAKAQLDAAEERDFQKGIAVMKLEEALAKSNADITSSASMHARDMAAANDSISRAQDQIAALQEQLDAAAGHIEALTSELATATEAQQMSATQASVLAANLKETEESLAFEKQMFGDLENKFMELQSKHTDAAAATFDSKRQTMAKSTDAASLRREIMAMETIQKDLEKSKEKLQKELAVVKSEYSLLKDKSLQDITALKEELHVAKAQGELRSVKGDASNIGRTAESREKEVDRLKASIKALEEAKKTLQSDKAAITGDKINLELQLKSTGARLQALEKENEKLRDKAGKIGEARSEAQQAQAQAAEEAERAAMALEDYKMTKEQLIAIDEENAGLRTERAELHSLLNDTAQELDQKKQELADTEEMLEATAAELESCKAEVLIKTTDLQALGSALSQAEEQFATVSAAAAEAEAAASQTIAAMEAQITDISSQLETASSQLAEATSSIATMSAAAEEAQKELTAKTQLVAQLQLSLSDAEEQLVSITAREARSSEAEARRSAELQSARELVETLQQELAEKQREAEEAEGRVMELCEGTESLSQELQAAKNHIARQSEEKEHMARVAAAQVQQLAERSAALEDCEAQRNQANESLALMSARMDEMEEKVAAQDARLAQANAMYDQAQAKLDKLEGKAGSYEHISGVVKDQNESLAKELSSLHRQVEELEAQLQNVQDELRTEKTLSKINQEAAADEVARAREEIKRAMDGKDALQRQLSAAKAGSSGGGGKEQSVLSLMMEVEDLKNKLSKAESAPAASAGSSKKEEEYAELMKKYEHLKATQKSREAAALEIAEKQKVQIKRYREKIAGLESQLGISSVKQQTALAEDKENVKAQ